MGLVRYRMDAAKWVWSRTHAHPRPIPTDQPAGWTGSCLKPRRAIIHVASYPGSL